MAKLSKEISTTTRCRFILQWDFFYQNKKNWKNMEKVLQNI